MKITILIASLLFWMTTYSQNYSDWTLFYKGKTKTFTSASYDELTLKNGKWQPKDTTAFNYKLINYNNNRGYLDSSRTYERIKEAGKEKVQLYIYSYKQDTVVTGLIIYEEGKVVGSQSIEWVDAYTRETKTYDSSKKLIHLNVTKLNKQLRVMEMEDISYNNDGVKESVVLNEWKRNKEGHSIAQTIKTKTPEGWEIEELIIEHPRVDSYSFPLETIRMVKGVEKPKMISYNTIEYY